MIEIEFDFKVSDRYKYFGFYVILAGWVVALIGNFVKK